MNKEEIIAILKKKGNRYQRQRYRGTAYNDDDYEAFNILNHIEDLQSQLDQANRLLEETQKIKNKIKEYCKININYYSDSDEGLIKILSIIDMSNLSQ